MSFAHLERGALSSPSRPVTFSVHTRSSTQAGKPSVEPYSRHLQYQNPSLVPHTAPASVDLQERLSSYGDRAGARLSGFTQQLSHQKLLTGGAIGWSSSLRSCRW